MLKTMKEIYDLMRANMLKTLEQFDLVEKDLSEAEEILHANKENACENSFMLLLQKAVEKGKSNNILDYNSIARDSQLLSNYFIDIMPDGRPISRFIYNTEMVKEESGRKNPKDYLEFMRLTLQAHQEILNYFSNIEKIKNEKYKKINEKIKKSGLSFDEFEEDYEVHHNAISVCHHALCWYLMVEPFNAYRRTSKQLAAISIYIVKRFYESMTGYAYQYGTVKNLSKFGEWKGSTAASNAGYGPFYAVMHEIKDPLLFFDNTNIIPRDWERRFKKLFEY